MARAEVIREIEEKIYELQLKYEQKIREKTIAEIEDKISNFDWYHIHNGKLVQGANTSLHEALYKASDIEKIFKELKIQKECCTCKNLMFSDCYGECIFGGIVNPHDTCKKWEKKE